MAEQRTELVPKVIAGVFLAVVVAAMTMVGVFALIKLYLILKGWISG
jgi:hypothetical protein